MEMMMLGLQAGTGQAIVGEASSMSSMQQGQTQGATTSNFGQMLVQLIGSDSLKQQKDASEMTFGMHAALPFHMLQGLENEPDGLEALLQLLKQWMDEHEGFEHDLDSNEPEMKNVVLQIMQHLEILKSPYSEPKLEAQQSGTSERPIPSSLPDALTSIRQTVDELLRMHGQQENALKLDAKTFQLLNELRTLVRWSDSHGQVEQRLGTEIVENSKAQPLAGRVTNPFNANQLGNQPSLSQQTSAQQPMVEQGAHGWSSSNAATDRPAFEAMLANRPVQFIDVALQARTKDSTQEVVIQSDVKVEQSVESANPFVARTAGELQLKSEPLAMHIHRFSSEMSDFILKSMRFTQMAGVSEAKLTLVPEQLGQVEVKLTMQNGQLIAQFVAETLAGKEALESQLPQLRAALQTQGIQVEKLEVSQQLTELSHQFSDERNPQFSQQFAQRKQNQASNYTMTGLDFDEELGDTMEALRSVYGSSFEVTA